MFQTLHHNRAKSLMALGRHLRARDALSQAIDVAGGPAAYPAAADKRAERKQQEDLKDGLLKFNLKPKNGLKYLQEKGYLVQEPREL